jgi:MFS transporter, NNP family, nitrate/nitrite transporter
LVHIAPLLQLWMLQAGSAFTISVNVPCCGAHTRCNPHKDLSLDESCKPARHWHELCAIRSVQSKHKGNMMSVNKTSFWKAGHTPTLISAFLYFDLAFMVWVLLGPLGVQIAKDLQLDAAQKGLMVAVPVLSGALLRIVAGLMVDHLGPKRTGIVAQIIVMAALAWAWMTGITSYEQVLALGVLLGVAGASFAVALPLASRWYPPEHQGTALGIAGAGNSGTAFAALLAPTLAVLYGWNNVFGLALIPLAIVFVIYLIVARDAPNPPAVKSLKEYLSVLKDKDAWWFMFFYSVTFGGFVGLAASLTIYFNTQYGLDAKTAGFFTAACVFAGSLVRPIGGNIADRVGGIKSLSVMYVVASIALFVVSFGLPSAWAALSVFVVAMLAFGMGNGAVFQLVPQRFRKEIGVMTGLVGMAGGIGGFYLASSLGYSKKLSGSYQLGFIIFATLAVVALVGLTMVKQRWRTTWGSAAMTTARI